MGRIVMEDPCGSVAIRYPGYRCRARKGKAMFYGKNRSRNQAGSLDAESGLSPSVKITPNRNSIDNRFPVLGFTISTGGLQFFEVLLTTDRMLFAPANAALRNAGNFYASRQDSGLILATGPESVYLAPPAVLRGFAQAQPRPSAIYFTLIAYPNAEGASPVFAQAPERLPQEAPSVMLAGDFTGQTLSTVLGVPIEQLIPASAALAAGQENWRQMPIYQADGYASAEGMPPDALVDRGEGEDGYTASHGDSTPDGHGHMAKQYGEDDFDFMGDIGDAFAVSARPLVNGYAGETLGDDDGFDYRDGYENEYGPVYAAARALESTFPDGAPEPEPLSDDETPYGESLGEEAPGEDLGVEGFALEEAPDGEDQYESAEMNYGAEDYGNESFDSQAAALDEFAYDEADEPGMMAQHIFGQAEQAELDDYRSDKDRFDEHEQYQDESHSAAYEDDDYGLSYQALDVVPASALSRPPLTIDDRKRIIQHIAHFESGRDGYGAINADGEFEGRFGATHPAYQRYHIGLSYGLIQFTQDSGLLGRLLVMMRERDAQAFNDFFGPDPQTIQQLIAVTTARGPSSRQSPGGRSARLQPVAGADLWREPWLSRFRRAGQHVPFQAAQNQLASEVFIDSMLRFAAWLGLDTDRALTMAVDRAVGMGPGRAKAWIIAAVGPIATDALRQQALTALGASDVRAFQRATPGLRADGEFGPTTHAAMVAALRTLGARSPIPIPTHDQMLDAMVRHAAASSSWSPRRRDRVRQIRVATDFTDTPYQL